MDDLIRTLGPLAQTYAPVVLEQASKFAMNKLNKPKDALELAAVADDTKEIRSILRKDPNINRAPALVAAAAAGKLDALDELLEPPPPPRHESHHHHHDSVESLIKVDPNVWASGTTPLLAAVKNKHSKTVKLLLKAGAEPDLKTKNGNTALIQAAQIGDTDCCKQLLRFGADVDAQNHTGDTALILATRFDHPDTVCYLLDHGANVDARNKKWATPLLIAARHDYVDVMSELIKHGADIRAKDKKGRTALHRAVEGLWVLDGVGGSAKQESVRLLMRAGANPRSKDREGKTPLERLGMWGGLPGNLGGGQGIKKLLEGRSRSIEHVGQGKPYGRSNTL
jgi:ankyrin repeat protein